MYDGPLDGSNKPTGTVLSKDQAFPLAVVRGKANVPTITLSGVPSGLQFSGYLAELARRYELPLFTLPAILVAGQGVSGRFAVYATDPDGNVILGPGAPAFAVSVSGGFSATVGGNTVRLAVPSPANTNVSADDVHCDLAGLRFRGRLHVEDLCGLRLALSDCRLGQ